MLRAVLAIYTLLLGIAVILAGNGLLGTLLGVRGEAEGFSSAVLGVVMAAYFLGFMLGTLLIPGWVRQFGHIRVFAALASMASVVALAHGLLVLPELWFLLRLISGICIVGIYIVIESWLNAQTGNEQRGHVFAVYMTTTLIGLGIGQFLLVLGDPGQLELFALVSVLLSLGLIPVAFTRVVEPKLGSSVRFGVRRLYQTSPLGVIGALFSGLGGGAFWALGPVFAVGIGLPTAGVAVFMGMTIIGGVLMLWPVGRLSDRYDRRRVLMWVCTATALAAAMGSWLVTLGWYPVLAAGFAYGAFSFSIYALSAAHTNDHLAAEDMLEATSGLQLLWGIGATIGPVLAGFAMHWFGPWLLLPFLGLAGLVPAVFARWRMSVAPPVPLEAQGDYVPQFATSPVALEMYPEDQEESAEQDDKE